MRYLHTPFSILLGAVMLLVGCGDGELQSTRRSVRYLIPDGYVGWLRIDYGVNDAHAPGYGVKRALPLPVKDGAVIVELPPGGHLVTSSPMEFGAARDEYYYSGNGGLKALSQAHDTGMVCNKFNGRFGALRLKPNSSSLAQVLITSNTAIGTRRLRCTALSNASIAVGCRASAR